MDPTTGNELLGRLEALRVLPDDFQHARAQFVERSGSGDITSLLARLHQAQWLTSYQLSKIDVQAWPELVVASYRLLEPLAEEAFGSVYRAEHVYLRRAVVVRLVSKTAAEFVALSRHLRAAADLDERVIVPAVDIGRVPFNEGAEPGTFIVSPWIAGQDLRELVNREGPAPLQRVAALHLPVVQALRKAHASGLTHGSFGPSKVRVDADDRVWLVDFGAAATAVPAAANETTALRDDVRGLGLSLFWCLSGRLPDALGDMTDWCSDVPPALANLIQRALRGEALALADFENQLGPLAATPRSRPAPSMYGDVALAFSPTSSLELSAKRRLLIVDDQPFVRSFCRIALEQQGHLCDEAEDGPAALASFGKQPYDLVLLDIDMPVMSGWQVCRELRRLPGRPHLKIVLFSGRASPDDLAKMMLAGADDYLTKPFTPVQLASRVEAALELQQAQARMDRLNRDLLTVNHELETHLSARDSDLIEARNALVLALAKLAESRDNDTGAHLQRLQVYSRRLAEEALGCPALSGQLDGHFVDMLACCAPLHDIGKVGLPDFILQKPGPLSPEERKLMQTHTVIGAETLREVARRHGFALAFLRMSIDIARHHHERYDGEGYPDRLKGESIPLAARIVTVCDVYDALRSKRVYKAAMPHPEVVSAIVAGAGTQFDPGLIDCFRRCADDFERIFDEFRD
jgi:putative two-component system response regulator